MINKDKKALEEILRICQISLKIVDRGEEWFFADPENVPGMAAESLIIKIGENVARLSPGIITRYTQVPWSAIKRMRDRLAHHYEATDYVLVWDTLVYEVPEIREQIQKILRELIRQRRDEIF